MKFLFLGKYSNAGLAGFLKNPEDDRRAAISAMVEKSGGNFIDLQFLRGKYDIGVVAGGFELRRCSSCESFGGCIGGFKRIGDARIY
jgi:hypothetical protein